MYQIIILFRLILKRASQPKHGISYQSTYIDSTGTKLCVLYIGPHDDIECDITEQTLIDNVLDFDTLLVGHEPEDGKCDKPGEKTRPSVDDTDNQRITAVDVRKDSQLIESYLIDVILDISLY